MDNLYCTQRYKTKRKNYNQKRTYRTYKDGVFESLTERLTKGMDRDLTDTDSANLRTRKCKYL